MSSGMNAHVSRKLSNCKKVRQAGNLKSPDGAARKRAGGKVREAGGQGTESGRFWPLKRYS